MTPDDRPPPYRIVAEPPVSGDECIAWAEHQGMELTPGQKSLLRSVYDWDAHNARTVLGIVNPPDDPYPRDLKPQTPNAGHYRAGRNPVPGRPWKRYFKTILSAAVVIAIGTPLLVWAIEWAVDTFLLGGGR